MLENVGDILKDYHRDHGIVLGGDHPPVRTSLLHRYIEERGVVDKISILRSR